MASSIEASAATAHRIFITIVSSARLHGNRANPLPQRMEAIARTAPAPTILGCGHFPLLLKMRKLDLLPGYATMLILVVEDDAELALDIVNGLIDAGHTTSRAESLAQARAACNQRTPRIVVLDRLLPDGEGLELIPWLRRRHPAVKILVLSALASVDARVGGLNAGADDYLGKPYAMPELHARINALARRDDDANQPCLGSGALVLDRIRRRITVGGESLRLKPREYLLLEYLLLHSGEVVSREMILRDVWGYNFDPGTNVIDVHMSRLRAKLAATAAAGCLETVRGEGYRLDALGA